MQVSNKQDSKAATCDAPDVQTRNKAFAFLLVLMCCVCAILCGVLEFVQAVV